MLLITAFFLYTLVFFGWRYGVAKKTLLGDSETQNNCSFYQLLTLYYFQTGWLVAIAAVMAFSILVNKWWVLPSVLVFDFFLLLLFHYGKKWKRTHP